jgi:hypothetical protein
MARTRSSLAKEQGAETSTSPMRPAEKRQVTSSSSSFTWTNRIMVYLPATAVAVIAGFLLQSKYTSAWTGDQIPEQAQYISPKSWAVLDQVASPDVYNDTSVREQYPARFVSSSISSSSHLALLENHSKPNPSWSTRMNSTKSSVPSPDGRGLFRPECRSRGSRYWTGQVGNHPEDRSLPGRCGH